VFFGGVWGGDQRAGVGARGFTTKKRRARREEKEARGGLTTKYSKFTKGEAGATVLVVGGGLDRGFEILLVLVLVLDPCLVVSLIIECVYFVLREEGVKSVVAGRSRLSNTIRHSQPASLANFGYFVYFVVKQFRLRIEREIATAAHFLHSHPTNSPERRRQGLPPGEDDIGRMRTAINQKSISRLNLTVYN
jgi:hypothetical protein